MAVDTKAIKIRGTVILNVCEGSCNRAELGYFAMLSMTKYAGSTSILLPLFFTFVAVSLGGRTPPLRGHFAK